jgi:hypothetical protein
MKSVNAFTITRNQRGGGIIEGAVGMMILMFAAVAATLLILNVSMLSYYQGKLGSITQQAATFASCHNFDKIRGDVNSETTDFVKSLFANAQMQVSNIGVTVTQTNVNGLDADVVTVSCTCPLFGNVTYMPQVVPLKDSEVHVIFSEPIAYAWWPAEAATNKAFVIAVEYASYVANPGGTKAMLASVGQVNSGACLQHAQNYVGLMAVPSIGGPPGVPMGPPPYGFGEVTFPSTSGCLGGYAGLSVIP